MKETTYVNPHPSLEFLVVTHNFFILPEALSRPPMLAVAVYNLNVHYKWKLFQIIQFFSCYLRNFWNTFIKVLKSVSSF